MNAIAWKAAIGAAVLAFGATAGAATQTTPGGYSQVIAFGDSLSDTGNMLALIGQPTAPYLPGRYSDGLVAVERLATRLGEPITAWRAGGTNYAHGGAGSGVINEAVNANSPGAPAGLLNTGMLSQYGAYVASLGAGGQADPNALYFVWGGANDLRYGGFNPALLAPTVANLTTIVGGLLDAGAQHLLLPLLPDVGLTPEARAFGPGAAAGISFLTDAFNDLLTASYLQLAAAHPDADVTIFDSFAAHREITANAAAYGLTNVADACLSPSSPTPVCATPGTYMYWDGVHPTGAMHALLADRFFDALAVGQAVPEPSTTLLLALAVAALGAASARRGQRAGRDASASRTAVA